MAAAKLTEDQVDDLIYFARANDLEELKATLGELGTALGCEPGTVLAAATEQESGNTPLHMAAANGHEDILKYLLSLLPAASANPSSTPSASTPSPTAGSTSFSSAPRTSSQSQADPTSSSTASSTTPTAAPPFIDHVNASRNTALHWAAVNGHVGCVRALVAAGAALALENAARHDALDEAERAGKADVVRFLLASMGGKKESEIVEEGSQGGGGEEEEEEEEAMEGGGGAGGVRVTQEQLEKLGLEER